HFFTLGGHSLLALKLLATINQSFGCALSIADIYRHPILQDLARRIDSGATVDPIVDLSQEARLDDDIVSVSRQRRTPERAVLLTGCTGFVGRFLLTHLLRETHATVFCLVRSHALQQAKARLKATLQKWDLWTPQAERRVIAIPADLSR